MTNQLLGRGLDAAVDRAMGYEVAIFSFKGNVDFARESAGGVPVPYYSTDETAAELLLQRCENEKGVVLASAVPNCIDLVEAKLHKVTLFREIGPGLPEYVGYGATLAEANSRACLAFLEAVK